MSSSVGLWAQWRLAQTRALGHLQNDQFAQSQFWPRPLRLQREGAVWSSTLPAALLCLLPGGSGSGLAGQLCPVLWLEALGGSSGHFVCLCLPHALFGLAGPTLLRLFAAGHNHQHSVAQRSRQCAGGWCITSRSRLFRLLISGGLAPCACMTAAARRCGSRLQLLNPPRSVHASALQLLITLRLSFGPHLEAAAVLAAAVFTCLGAYVLIREHDTGAHALHEINPCCRGCAPSCTHAVPHSRMLHPTPSPAP